MVTSEEKFQAFYETSLKPKLETLEKQRKSGEKKLRPISNVLIALFIMLMVAILVKEFFSDSFFNELVIRGLIMTLFVIGIIFSVMYSRFYTPYRKNFKKEVVSLIVTFVDKSFAYYPEERITLTEFRISMLDKFFRPINRFKGEDYVEGMLGKTAVKISEVDASYKIGKSTSTIFNGLFFIFDFNKDFEGFTVILPDYAERYLGSFEKMLQSRKSENIQGELVKLEDIEFEREFVVYSDNQITARYILSTRLMRRLLTFRHKLKKQVYLSFVDGKLYLGIPILKDLFEPTVYKTLLDFNIYREFFEYLQLSKDIVEDLDFNTPILTKD